MKIAVEDLVRMGESIQRPCYCLHEAGPGEPVVAYWGGSRSDIPESFPPVVTRFSSRRHILSFDYRLAEDIGIRYHSGYHFALMAWTWKEGGEVARDEQVKSLSVSEVTFCDSVPLTARQRISFPPLQALCLYGDERIAEWLKSERLERWQYDLVDGKLAGEYEEEFQRRCPFYTYTEDGAFAQLGGWHLQWMEDDYYVPREMNLLCVTFEDAEPWYEISVSGRGHVRVREHIT
jgi:hypothetical protein